MVMQQIHLSNSSPTFLILHNHKPSFGGINYPSFQVWSRPSFQNQRKQKRVTYGCTSTSSSASKIKAVAMTEAENIKKVKATMTVQPTVGGLSAELGNSLLLELVSTTLDPKTKVEKENIKDYDHRTHQSAQEVKYEAEFEVPEGFGEVGAVLVENGHDREMFIKDIVLEDLVENENENKRRVTFSCNSWVHSKHDNPVKRVFFSNKSYLPSETPEGVKRLREEELEHLRGNGQGERKTFERIYDYDVYNDLGDPDSSNDLKRPVLGGAKYPYPRRCRTGRPRCDKDPLSEKKSNSVSVPSRDDAFSEVKQQTFSTKTKYSALHALITATVGKILGFLRDLLPRLVSRFVEDTGKNLLRFEPPSTMNNPFSEKNSNSVYVPRDEAFSEVKQQTFSKKTKYSGLHALITTTIDIILAILRNHLLPWLVRRLFKDNEEDLLRFEPPSTMNMDRFFLLRDEEFGRQTLAGLNPCCIQLVTEWPLKSKLDPEIYGPAESAITTEIIEQEIKGFFTIEEAIKQKKLFMLDYHDLLLPLVKEVRKLKGTTLYGSRAVFFLTNEGTLRPLAIELTRPKMDGKPEYWKHVFTPTWNSTGVWLWRLAKLHILAHDSGYHQLVSHWLRTHCATEPYIIATNRQLSEMHPIYRLLHPHFRYTMEINALARKALINANGIIESNFTPGKHSILLSSTAYDKHWQFNLQSLPEDLLNRGMAVLDSDSPHGLKLTIEDYPYANDGLFLWDALKSWITDYVENYYSDNTVIGSDQELQKWWEEIITVGHADKKDEPWWPKLKTKDDLIEILTTITWTTSGHHAAVNFGQFSFGKNRPTIASNNMPIEDPSDPEWELFLEKPEEFILKCFPGEIQSKKVMTVLDILSNHSPDEQYLGEAAEAAWEEEPMVKAAFEKFKGKLMEMEGEIDKRNADRSRMNRNGAGIVPYELFKPLSEPGVTSKGVPYSISI